MVVTDIQSCERGIIHTLLEGWRTSHIYGDGLLIKSSEDFVRTAEEIRGERYSRKKEC
jgi:hypothetical protein